MNTRSLFHTSWVGSDTYHNWTRLALVGVPLALLLLIFGLPKADIHGPLHYVGVMGPTCGMTRGVMWFIRGDLGRAWMFNPASLLVIPTMGLLLTRSVYGWLTGRWLSVSVRWRPWLWVVAAGLVVALAIRQQLIVDFLLANPSG